MTNCFSCEPTRFVLLIKKTTFSQSQSLCVEYETPTRAHTHTYVCTHNPDLLLKDDF